MPEQIEIFGSVVELPSLGGTTWRVRKRLIEARLCTMLQLGRFSDSENLLYVLAKRDLYLRHILFAPAGLSAKRIRQQQRRRSAARHQPPTTSLKILLRAARAEAVELFHREVGVEHLLLALLKLDHSSANLLADADLTYDRAREVIRKRGVAGYHVKLFGLRPTFWQSNKN